MYSPTPFDFPFLNHAQHAASCNFVFSFLLTPATGTSCLSTNKPHLLEATLAVKPSSLCIFHKEITLCSGHWCVLLKLITHCLLTVLESNIILIFTMSQIYL